ncbi:MAG TPA: hypothetical protein VL132_22800, partial [Planctomycetaceae bacterium]|nr:hypothetical protein [Planctomycetaceae bacterium]
PGEVDVEAANRPAGACPTPALCGGGGLDDGGGLIVVVDGIAGGKETILRAEKKTVWRAGKKTAPGVFVKRRENGPRRIDGG